MCRSEAIVYLDPPSPPHGWEINKQGRFIMFTQLIHLLQITNRDREGERERERERERQCVCERERERERESMGVVLEIRGYE